MLILHGSVNASLPITRSHIHHQYKRKYLRTLKSYLDQPERIKHIMQTYYSFMFVRDPMERLLSAYRDKFRNASETYYVNNISVKIAEQYRSHVAPGTQYYKPEYALSSSYMVTFKEFVSYVIATGRKGHWDTHWQPYHTLCRPCALHYNMIGRYEHLKDDAQYILKEAGLDQRVEFPHMNTPQHLTPTKELLENALETLTVVQIKTLLHMYDIQYAMFGYESSNIHIHSIG